MATQPEEDLVTTFKDYVRANTIYVNGRVPLVKVPQFKDLHKWAIFSSRFGMEASSHVPEFILYAYISEHFHGGIWNLSAG